MSKSAVLTKFAKPGLFEKSTHYSFIVTVWHRVVVFLLTIYFIYVVWRKRITTFSQFMIAVCKMASTASLATKTFHEVLADRGFELFVKLRKTGSN
jgi:hypothetical protein